MVKTMKTLLFSGCKHRSIYDIVSYIKTFYKCILSTGNFLYWIILMVKVKQINKIFNYATVAQNEDFLNYPMLVLKP